MRLVCVGLLAMNLGWAACVGPGAPICTVKPSGGDYSSISACTAAMANGDTCLVFAGTYGAFTIGAGGVGSYRTVEANVGDLVYVPQVSVNSHNKLIGLHIQDPLSPVQSLDCISIANSSTDIYITNNTIYACTGNHASISTASSSGTATFVYVQGNTISYPGSTPTSNPVNVGLAVAANGDHWLVENNDFSHTSDDFHWAGSNMIFRNNTSHDHSVNDCGSQSGNCHVDFLQSESTVATQHNVHEANTVIRNIGHDMHAFIDQGDVCAGSCFGLIIRFNTVSHVTESGIIDDNAGQSGVNPGFYAVKSYNNTWVDVGGLVNNGQANGFENNSIQASEINDLFYYPEAETSYTPYRTDASTTASFTVRNNLGWCTGSPCTLHGQSDASSSFTAEGGNVISDPLFVNYAADNYNLSVGSPAIATGSYLTTVDPTDTGSGTSLIVADANFFQDGYGLSNANSTVSADCISVTTVTNHVCITAVTYPNSTSTTVGTLTLASPITRSSGDHIWLFSDSNGRRVLYGAAPNIGSQLTIPAASTVGSVATSIIGSGVQIN